jgi:hypothetical protein
MVLITKGTNHLCKKPRGLAGLFFAYRDVMVGAFFRSE